MALRESAKVGQMSLPKVVLDTNGRNSRCGATRRREQATVEQRDHSVVLAERCPRWESDEMGAARISVVVDDDGAIQLPPTFGYDQGFRKGAGIRLRPVEVNGAPFDASMQRAPVLHLDDQHVIVALNSFFRFRIYPAQLEKFGFHSGDRVVFDLIEETRSSDELDAAGVEWRRAHGIPELTDDEIAEIASDAMREN